MKYNKIKVSFKEYPKRLNRTIAIREDVDLLSLGAIIGYTLEAWFEHFYLFRTKDSRYVVDDWLDDDFFENSYSMKNVMLSEMPDVFTFEYDTGEGYEFEVKKMKSTYNHEAYDYDYPLAMVIDGKGQGLFENDIRSLVMYLKGDIDPNLDHNIESKGIYLPMNMEFDKFSDFEKDLDFDFLNWYDDEIELIKNNYLDEDEREDLDEIDEDLSIFHLFSLLIYSKINEEHPNTNEFKKRLKELEKLDLEDRPVNVMGAIAINAVLKMIGEDNPEVINRILKEIDDKFNLNEL